MSPVAAPAYSLVAVLVALVVVLLALVVGAVVHPHLLPSRRPVAGAVGRTSEQRRRRVALVGLAVATAFITGPVLALAIVGAAAGSARWRRMDARKQHQRAVAAALPDAIDMIVLAVRAGFLPFAAIEMVLPHLPPPVRSAFADVVGRVRDGRRFADGLGALEESLGAGARPLIDSFAAADRYGLPLAPVLERLAGEARRQRGRVADAFARQLPVRLSLPLVLCTLPSFVLLAIVPLLLGAFSSLHT